MSPLRLWVFRLLTAALPESRGFAIKRLLLRWAGARIGANVRIYTSAKILGNGGLFIGNDVHIGPDVLIVSSGSACVRIGDCVDIGPRVTLVTGSHKVNFEGPHVAGEGISMDISLGKGCWIGSGATVLSGVAIPEMTLVAAGAVVATSVTEKCCLVAGVPAAVKRSLKGQ